MTGFAGDMPKLTTSATLSDQAYLALRDGITAGRFAAGQRLTERALAASLGVSPTPVREALQRLEHERLIERDATRSIRVADPSTPRLYELSLIEASLRGAAARLAAERASSAEAAAIIEVCDQADALESAPDLEARAAELLGLTRRFHAMVDAASHSRTLIDMIATATAFDWAFRLKWAAHIHRDHDSLRQSLGEHRLVAAAIQSGDGATAEETMRGHILHRTAAFLDIASHDHTLTS